jgi:hypothetical protein
LETFLLRKGRAGASGQTRFTQGNVERRIYLESVQLIGIQQSILVLIRDLEDPAQGIRAFWLQDL